MEITDKKEDVKNNLTAIVFNLPNNKIYIATIINQIPMNEQTVTFTISKHLICIMYNNYSLYLIM